MVAAAARRHVGIDGAELLQAGQRQAPDVGLIDVDGVDVLEAGLEHLAGQGAGIAVGPAAGATGNYEPEQRKRRGASGQPGDIEGWHSNQSYHWFAEVRPQPPTTS